ncbi:MAG: YdcF family protein, partial [Candidatus Harrisonbacteria bacterium CG10_big_fil_rev_8_21_14_0_10_38_8]
MSWNKIKKISLVLAIGLFFLFSCLTSAIYFYPKIDETKTADAVIVLGASQWNGNPSPAFQARLDRALDIYDNGRSPYIILTGGLGEGDSISEASVGKNYLVEKGVPVEAIFLEEKSRTTWQNLNNAQKILEGLSADTALLVSHDFHILRSEKMGRDLGIKILTSAVETKSPWIKLKFSTRE